MLSKFAKDITYFFICKNLIRKDEKEVYEYGYEILIAEVINWIITSVIAILTYTILESAVYMFAFIHLRENIGGFHAKTHIGCMILSTLVHVAFVILVAFTPIEYYNAIILLGIIVHMIIVLNMAPVAHPNKPFGDRKEYNKFRLKSNILSVCYSVICVLFIIVGNVYFKKFSYCIVLAMLSASVSMMCEWLIQKNKKGREVNTYEEHKKEYT